METNKDSIVDVRSVVEAISSDDNDAPLYQVESLCMRCRQNGTTRFLLTLIPHFRKILLSAFECPHCGERNNEVQFAGELQPRGCHYQLNFPPGDQKMLNRQVVKSDTATIKIPELDFEIPPEAQRGSLSTVEGILLRAADEIEALQEERKKVDPQSAEAIDRFLPKLRACAKGESSFTIILDDPAGNSFIENPAISRISATNDEEASAREAAATADTGAPTIFDKIIAKEIPSTIVYEDDKVLAFRDITPEAPVHVLVIPQFRDGLTQLGKAEARHWDILGELLYAAKIVAEREGILDGFRVVINSGPAACQSVYHLHLHLLGGRQMKWPPG